MIEIGDKVKQKRGKATRVGTIIGIWDDNQYIIDKEGNSILVARKGEFKVRFDDITNNTFETFYTEELVKM